MLLGVNEPTFGTKRKSQIQNYLEHNDGAGVQHLALKTDDIFATVTELKARSEFGFEFMPAPTQTYYDRVPGRIGEDVLSAAQLEDMQRLGVLADRDAQGVMLQILTKPVGMQPTFISGIQMSI